MWDIIIAICLVFAVVSPVWLIARFLKVELPKFLLPMIAGLSLLSYNAYMRYTWGDRTIEAFPPEVVALKTYRHSNAFEPWTFLVPRVSHMMAADTTKTQTNPDHPDVKMGAVVMLQEHQATTKMTVMVNCAQDILALLPTSAVAQGANPLEAAEWMGKEQFPEVYEFYCEGKKPVLD